MAVKGVLEGNRDFQQSGIKFRFCTFVFNLMAKHIAVVVSKILGFCFDTEPLFTHVKDDGVFQGTGEVDSYIADMESQMK